MPHDDDPFAEPTPHSHPSEPKPAPLGSPPPTRLPDHDYDGGSVRHITPPEAWPEPGKKSGKA